MPPVSKLSECESSWSWLWPGLELGYGPRTILIHSTKRSNLTPHSCQVIAILHHPFYDHSTDSGDDR